jgi:hypothetical protein
MDCGARITKLDAIWELSQVQDMLLSSKGFLSARSRQSRYSRARRVEHVI